MPKMATKAADNVFYKARIAAASWNDRLGSREGASEVTGIDRTRLANIELGTINPHPEEVLMLSDTYNAPELQNHFCSHLCPLGIGTISPIELEELERVTLQLISAMKSLPEVKDGIIDIAADGVIDASEKPRMEQYLEVLDEITNKAQTLKLIYPIGTFRSPDRTELAKLALDYISFSISSGHKGSAQVPTEDEMRNIQGAKSRADAARRGKLDDIIKELLKEDM